MHLQKFAERVTARQFNTTEEDVSNVVLNKAGASGLDLAGILALIQAIMSMISGLNCSASEDKVVAEIRNPRIGNRVKFLRSLRRELNDTGNTSIKDKHSEVYKHMQTVASTMSDAEVKDVLKDAKDEDYILI